MTRTRALAWSLVALAFLSKVSFLFTGVVPSSLGFVLFQGGIHPYLNVALNLVLGGALLASIQAGGEWPELRRFHPAYSVFAIGTIVILYVQHGFQLGIGIETNLPLTLVTLAACTFLITVFGILLPQLIPARELVRGVSAICLVICGLSLALYAAGAPAMFKGGRFIGVLKHIPYMVTCGSVGWFFTLDRWSGANGFKEKLALTATHAVFLACLWLTGTRSALLAVLIGTPVFILAYRTASPSFRMARVLGVWLGLVGVVLFGAMAADYASDVATGRRAIGNRAPQDGVSDRMDEISRGLDMLSKSPHVGLGLLSKFSSDDAEDVAESYNSFHDPHNLFISSAVVAGWPFGVWVLFGFLALAAGSVRLVTLREMPGLTLGVYLLSHLPILAIYHMHLSLGGLADRLYWLVFGYLALMMGPAEPPQKPRQNALF